MYLLIKKTGRNKTPLKLFQTLDRAKEELENYVNDSGFEWNWYIMGIKGYKKRYFRYIKKNRYGEENIREELYIIYMKVGA